MVRHLIKGGRRIKLLPPANPPEDNIRCGQCGQDYNSGERRRACFEVCGHVACLKCIFEMSAGCTSCASGATRDSQVISDRPAPPPPVVEREEVPERMASGGGRPQILILSSVLTKCGEEEDDFPEIQRLSLSALPVLECANEPPTYELEEEEDEEYQDGVEVEEEEEMEEETSNIPLIELSDDEDDDIPVIDLLSDEEEDNTVFRAPASEEEPSTVSVTQQHQENGNNLNKTQLTLPISDNDKACESSCVVVTPPPTPEDVQDLPSLEPAGIPEADSLVEEDAPRSLRKRRRSQCGGGGDNGDGTMTGFGNVSCHLCSTSGFIDKRSLARHLTQAHWDIRPYPCDICDWPFESQRKLDQHKLSHSNERPFKCTQCDGAFNRKYTLVKHLENIHGVMSDKTKSPKRSKQSVVTTNTKHDKLWEALTSPHKASRQHQVTPVISQVIEGHQPEEGPIPVPIPISFIDDDYTPIVHYSGPVASPDQDDNDFGDDLQNMEAENLDDPVSNSESFLELPSPPKRKRRKKPRSRAHNSVSKENKYTCSHCAKVFIGKTRLSNHLREDHSDKRPYPCDLCGWSFAQKNKLNLHRITHTIDRPHKCKQCEATFNRKYSLERHVRIMHLKTPRNSEAAVNKPSQKKAAVCPYCEISVENREELGAHLQKVHSEKRPHVCSECQWPFARRKHLVAHLRTHSQDKPYSCSMCDAKAFNRRFSLERHMDNVHGVRIRLTPEETPDGEEYCPECQSLFGEVNCQKVAYSECGHVSCMECVIRAELGCGQCTTEMAPKDWAVEEIVEGKIVRSRPGSPVPLEEMGDGLLEMQIEKLGEEVIREVIKKRRRRNVNVIAEEDELEELELARQLEKENSGVAGLTTPEKSLKLKSPKEKKKGRVHKCKYCGEEHSEKSALGIHLQYFHRDLRPFACDICQWPFSSMRDLERHQIIHTKDRPFKCQMCAVGFNRKSTRDRHVEKVHLKFKRIS